MIHHDLNDFIRQYQRQSAMHPGRLKLGPKRKEIGFNRIHKLHQENPDSQNVEQKPVLLSKTSRQESNDVEKDSSTETNPLKNYNRQLPATSSTVFGNWDQSNDENTGFTQRLHLKGNKELEEVKSKCEELKAQLISIQEENRTLKQQKQTEAIKLSHQFRVKQRQMENKIILLTVEKQNINNKEKVMEQTLDNSDKHHFQKQINRLKTQCQNLQIKTAENKYLLDSMKNQLQQKDNLLKNKTEDMKQLQKQIEKEKMNVAESRSQFSQKQRGLRVALEESQAANQVLCNSIGQMNRQLEREESARKEKSGVIGSLQKQIEVLVTRGRDSQTKCMQMRKNFENEAAQHSKRLFNAEQIKQSTFRQSQSLIQRLSSDLESLKAQQIEQMFSQNKEGTFQKEEEVDKGLQIVRLQQNVRQLNIILESRDQIIAKLEVQLKDYYSPQQYAALEKRSKELQEKRLNSARYYQQKLYQYQKDNDKLRLDRIEKVITPEHSSTFDEILKRTLEESEALRTQLKRMGENLASIKEQANQIRLREKGYLNQLQILRKRSECSSKNFGIEMQVQTQRLNNEIDSLRRKLSTAQTRLHYKQTENKQKDDFIKSVIVGRSDPIDREAIVAELERIFLQRDKTQLQIPVVEPS